MNEHDSLFRAQIIFLIKKHAKESSKVISEIKVKWIRSGKDLTVNGYAFEYENKPEK